jgi:tellurite resistance protein
MADDKTKRNGTDRARVSGSEPYEVDYFAKKHGLSRGEAETLIERVGNDREALNAAASEGKGAVSGDTTALSKRRKPRTRRSKSAAASRVPVVAAAVDAVTEAVVDPIAKVTRPARRKVAAATEKAAAATEKTAGTTRRAFEQATREAAKTPATLKREARQAGKAVKSAVLGRVASLVGAATAGLVAGVALGINRKAITAATELLGVPPRGDAANSAHTTLAERIARVLAGNDASANADGDAASASGEVDTRWRLHLPQALAVLKTLRVPSSGMTGSGDAQVWETMVLSAISEAERV